MVVAASTNNYLKTFLSTFILRLLHILTSGNFLVGGHLARLRTARAAILHFLLKNKTAAQQSNTGNSDYNFFHKIKFIFSTLAHFAGSSLNQLLYIR